MCESIRGNLGGQELSLDENGFPIKKIPRHPIVEDNVTIYSGATISAHRIGRGSEIGGNVWVDHDVRPGSKIVQGKAEEKIFRGGGEGI